MLVMAGVCLLVASPASAAGGVGIGSGRLVPTLAAVVGLIGVVLGGLALAAPATSLTGSPAGDLGRGYPASGRIGFELLLASEGGEEYG
jgi:hypothetical protein